MNPIDNLLDGQLPEYISSFEGTSQYTQGGISTCGLAALNAVRIILGRERCGIKSVELLHQIAKRPMIDDIIAICATWSSRLHLEVDDIIALPLFKTSLHPSFYEHCEVGVEPFSVVLRKLLEAGETSPSSRISSAVVITRPPEILAVFCIPTDISRCPNVFIVFDSHPRPAKGAKGASFIFFPTLEAASRYIADLLRVDPSILSSLGWQAQLLEYFSGHGFLAQETHNFNTYPMRPVYDANMEILELKARMRTQNTEKINLLERLTKMEEAKLLVHLQTSSQPYNSQTWGFLNDPSLSLAGPSRNHETKQGQHSTSFIVGSNDIVPFRVSGRPESHDGNFAAQLYLEQEKERVNLEAARRIQQEFDDEDQELRAQMRRLHRHYGTQNVFECGICFDRYPEDFVSLVDICGHKLCRGCMKDFITSKLAENRYPILCPICQSDKNAQDPGFITRDVVEQLGLTESQQAVWEELELSEFSVALDCPKCRRCAFVDITDHTNTKLLRCPLPGCNHVWCKCCHQTVKQGTKHLCNGTRELDNLVKSRGWKYCPGCETPTEKQSGCNHITCVARGCNTHFCYACGQSIVRSVKQKHIKSAIGTHYAQCKLFEDVPEVGPP